VNTPPGAPEPTDAAVAIAFAGSSSSTSHSAVARSSTRLIAS